MANLTIENGLQDAGLLSISGDVSLREGPSTTGIFEAKPPVEIIQKDQSYYVHFYWTQQMWLTEIIQGEWECTAYFEKMGSGETSGANPSTSVTHVQRDGHCYFIDVVIPANSLETGLYEVVASLTFKGGEGGRRPIPIAAFAELGKLQVYTA